MVLFFVAIFAEISARGQGTLEFQVALDSAHAVPPLTSTRVASGVFTLDGSLGFSGFIGMEDYADVTAVSLFRSTNPAQVGTQLFDFTIGLTEAPGPSGEPGSRTFNLSQTLSPAQAVDLESGFFWINVNTPAFPDGVIRGQITTVPEPSSLALLCSDGAWLCYAMRRKQLKW